MFLTEQGKIVLKLLDNVDDWNINNYDTIEKFYTIIHKSGLRLWVAGGIFNLQIDDRTAIPYVQIGFFDKFLLWPKVKKVMKYIIATNIATNLEKFKVELKRQGFDV